MAYRTRYSDSAAKNGPLAALRHLTALSVGCHCQDELRGHRSLLRGLRAERRTDSSG